MPPPAPSFAAYCEFSTALTSSSTAVSESYSPLIRCDK
jgi:hypothetical protein